MPEQRTYQGHVYTRNGPGDDWVLSAPAQAPAQSNIVIGRPNPQIQQKGAVDIAGGQISNEVAAATKGSAISKAGSEATAAARSAQTAGLPEGFMWAPDGSGAIPIPGYTRQGLSPEIRKGAIDAFNDARALQGIVADLRAQYKSGPGSTNGIRSLRDYLPTDENKVFDDTGQRARGYVKRSLGFTGGEGNTVAESSTLYDPYLPTAGDRDSQIESKIAALEKLANQTRDKAITTLGGIPDENGRVLPVAPALPSNALTQNNILPGGSPGAAPFGATQQQTAIPPAMQAAYDQWLAQNAATMTVDQYVDFRRQLDQQYGFGSHDAANRAWADDAIKRLQRGGATINSTIPGATEDMSTTEWLRNSAVSNPVGGAAVGGLNSLGFGGVEALAPDQFNALSDSQGVPVALGSVAGAIGGTGLIGKLGRETIGRAAPGLLGGGGAAQFGRNLAADTAYSGLYGATTQGNPLPSMAVGAAGSVLGQGVGSGLGRLVGGVRASPVLQALTSREIRPTAGQALGGFAKSIEDGATSAPIIGDIINARRLEGFQDFNRAALSEAGAPIGATVNDIGEAGLDQLSGQISNAYDAATSGVRVPLDPQFQADLAVAKALGQKLPPDYAAKFDILTANRLDPAIDMGELTGEAYQQTMRGFKGARRSAGQAAPGFEQDYRDAVTALMDATKGQMVRGGGDSVVQGLAKADEANRLTKTVAAAQAAAKNGSGSGEIQVFTPAQLNTAAYSSQRRFPGQRPFAELADAGQQVLPSKIPDSGTARRGAQLVLPAALGGSGAGLGYTLSGDNQGGAGAQQGAISGAIVGALLAAGGSRKGQNAIVKLLLDRPDAARKLGLEVINNAGLVGSGTLPFALQVAK